MESENFYKKTFFYNFLLYTFPSMDYIYSEKLLLCLMMHSHQALDKRLLICIKNLLSSNFCYQVTLWIKYHGNKIMASHS